MHQQQHELKLRVRYAETDQMRVVYHANYLVWMEMGRVELCRAAGLRYRDMEENDRVFLAVVEVNCRYLYPARYDEEVVVRTRILQATPRLIRFGYEMEEPQARRKLVTGHTTHVTVGEDMRPCRLPERYWTHFGIPARAAAE